VKLLYIFDVARLENFRKENQMNYRIMFVLNALVALVFGLGFLIIPNRILELFGTETYNSTVLVSRFFGTAMFALGLVLWFAKNADNESVQRGMGIALFVGALAGLIVTVMGVSSASGVIRSNGWIVIVLYLLFGLGYAYLVFLKPRVK
jgi:hypothetical protein